MVWLDILGNVYSLDDGILVFGLVFYVKMDIEDRMNYFVIGFCDLFVVFFNVELVEGLVVLKIDLIIDLEIF